MNLSSPTALSTQIPSEIVGEILSYLGKCDLLNARFVCRSWNEESVRVLQNSRFTQTLCENRIGEYLEFVGNNKDRKFILPFYLNFTVYFHKFFSQFTTKAPQEPLKILIKHVDTLCHLFGSECVSGLKLMTADFLCNNEVEFLGLGVLELFELISPGLKELDLTEFRVHVQIGTRLHSLTHWNPTFPNLKKINCNPYDNRSLGGNTIVESTSLQFLPRIIPNSPNLLDLKIQNISDLNSWPLCFDKLKTFAFDIILDPSHVLDKIRQCNSNPVLRELHFGKNFGSREHNVGHGSIVYKILVSVSATLKTLKVYTAKSYDERMIRLPFPKFPSLPNLENLEIDISPSYHGGLNFINYEEINFNPTTLPSLKTANFPFGLIFINTNTPQDPSLQVWNWNTDLKTEEDEDAEEVGIVFPTVNKITIRIDKNYDFMKQYGLQPMKHVLKLFPNSTSICIGNGSHHHSSVLTGRDQHRVKYLLSQMIQSDWANQIHEIELNGFDQDYLGQVLTQLDHPPSIVLHNCDGDTILEESIKTAFQSSIIGIIKKIQSSSSQGLCNSIVLQEAIQLSTHKMNNIRKIRLEVQDTTDRSYEILPLELHSLMPNLTAMAKHFPRLEIIEISRDLFTQKNFYVGRGQLQTFISQVSGVVVDVI